MAAPAFESATTGSYTGSSTVTCTGPSTVTAGDLLVAFLADNAGSASVTTPPTGWTEDPAPFNSGGGDARLHILWKIATAGDSSGAPVDYDFDYGGDTPTGAYAVHRYSGADTAQWDVDGNAEAGAASVTVSAITTTVDDTLLVAVGFYDDSTTSPDPGWDSPCVVGWTEGSNHTGASSVKIGTAHKAQASAGSTGDMQLDSAATDALGAVVIAIAPTSGSSVDVTVTGINSTSEVGAPTVTYVPAPVAVTIDGIDSTSEVGALTVGFENPPTHLASTRTLDIPAQVRTLDIPAQDRTLDIPAQDRTLDIP